MSDRGISLRRIVVTGVVVAVSCYTEPRSLDSFEIVWNRTMSIGSGVHLRVAGVVHRAHTGPNAGGWSCGAQDQGWAHHPARPAYDVWDARIVVVPGAQDHAIAVDDHTRWAALDWTSFTPTRAEAAHGLETLHPRICPNAEGTFMVVVRQGAGQVFAIDQPTAASSDLADVVLGPCDTAPPGGLPDLDALCRCVAVHTGLLGPRAQPDGG